MKQHGRAWHFFKSSFDSLAGWRGKQITLGTESQSFWNGFWGWANPYKKTVTAKHILQLSAAWACIKLIAETISSLPCNVFEKPAGQSRRLADDADIYTLLHDQPNAEMSALEFWVCILASLLLYGNAYVRITRYAGLRSPIIALDPLLPFCVSVERLKSGAIEWTYANPDTGREEKLSADDMWHTPAFKIGGLLGLSPIQYGSMVFAGSMAAEDSAASVYASRLKSPGIVAFDQAFRAGQREEIRKHVREVNADGDFMVLEKFASFVPMRMSPQDAQLLATREFGVEEVCRWFGVPPFMVGHGQKSTTWGSGLEQQVTGMVIYLLRPWCVRIEQSARRSLLRSGVERKTFKVEFALEGLLRGDSAARAQFYASAAQNGWLTRNEIRELENRPPVDGGDTLTVQSNLMPLDQLGQAGASTEGEGVRSAIQSWLGILDLSGAVRQAQQQREREGAEA